MIIAKTSSRARAAWIVAAAALLALIAVFAVWRFWPGGQAEPGYTPPPRDALAAEATGFPADIPSLNTGAYAVSFQPDMRVGADGNCEIWLRNPQSNPCYLMLDVRLADGGLLIYRTGLVAPGEGIRAITFVPDALAAMREGGQDVELTVRSFHLGDYINLGDLNLSTRLTYDPR